MFLKKEIQVYVLRCEFTQTQKTNLWLPKGKEEDKLGVWDQQIQTTIYEIDKQLGPTVQLRELYSISCNKP